MILRDKLQGDLCIKVAASNGVSVAVAANDHKMSAVCCWTVT